MTLPTQQPGCASPTAVAPKNRLSPKKLLLSKWTAVAPVNKDKHFLVTRVLLPDAVLPDAVLPDALVPDGQRPVAAVPQAPAHPAPTAPVEWVEIEAVRSGQASVLRWRDLTDATRWRQGWV